MATKNDTKTATAAREQAEAAVEQAQAELDAAEQHEADLRAKLADGDASITASQLVESDAAIDRARILLSAAQRKLSEAQDAERRAIAAELSEALSGRTFSDGTEARDAARDAVKAALGSLRQSIAGRNGQLSKAASQAKAAGLVAGAIDPLAATYATARGSLVVDGAEYRPIDVTKALIEAVSDAFELLDTPVDITLA